MPSVTAKTEDWNGVSWVETTDMNTARTQLGGRGTATSGVVFGGGFKQGQFYPDNN